MPATIATKIFAAALFGGSLFTFSGCMVNPVNDQHLGYYYGSAYQPIHPGGFLSEPNTSVSVQAYEWRTNRWVTVATAISSRTPYRWDGRDWYYWQTKRVRLENRFWSSYWGEADAKIRTLSEGNALYTFDEWTWTPDSTLGEVAQGVNGMEITIHSWMFEADP